MKKLKVKQHRRDIAHRLKSLRKQRLNRVRHHVRNSPPFCTNNEERKQNMPNSHYPIIDISDQDIDDFEQMGTKSKFWYTDSQTGDDYLFKSIHTEDGQGTPVERIGEDWAEKIACELAEVLGIPHAHYELANYQGQRGIRSKKFTTEGDNMFFGNQLIEHIANRINIPLEAGQRSQKVERVATILALIIRHPPKNWIATDNIKTAFDIFIGYMMLDTLISNQDRHNENWAMISNGSENSLAPSFDHAASLGRNESIENMQRRLASNDIGQQIPTYVNRSKSYFYTENKRLKTLEAFLAFASFRKSATLEWLERLETVDLDKITQIVSQIPECIMGQTEKDFCIGIIIANKSRILQYKEQFQEQKKQEDKETTQ